MAEIIVTTKNQLCEIVSKEVEFSVKKALGLHLIDLKKEKLSQFQAAKLIDVSLPTLNKLVKQGRFTQHNLGRKKYFIKGQLLEELKNYQKSESK